LKAPVKRIKPYQLPKHFDYVDAREKITAVNTMSRDFYKVDGSGRKAYPKSIQECESREVTYHGPQIGAFESTCAGAGGASGSAALKRNSRGNILVGIMHDNTESESERIRSEQGEIIVKPYSPGKWTSYHTSVTGKFLETLRRTTGQIEN